MDQGARGAIPVREIEREAVRMLIQQADVIYGYDIHKGTRHLFYGEGTLRYVAQSGQAQHLAVLTFAVDFREESPELEYLYAAIEVLKGSCCYNGESRPRDG